MQNVFSLMTLELGDFLPFLRVQVACDARVARWSAPLDEITTRRPPWTELLPPVVLPPPALTRRCCAVVRGCTPAKQGSHDSALACSRSGDAVVETHARAPTERQPARAVAESRARTPAERWPARAPTEWWPARVATESHARTSAQRRPSCALAWRSRNLAR
jgi:hypothetical protein